MRLGVRLLAQVIEALGEMPVLRDAEPILVHPAQVPERHRARLRIGGALVRSDRFFVRVFVALDADAVVYEGRQRCERDSRGTYSNSRRP